MGGGGMEVDQGKGKGRCVKTNRQGQGQGLEVSKGNGNDTRGRDEMNGPVVVAPLSSQHSWVAFALVRPWTGR